jgi:hypothetical protein
MFALPLQIAAIMRGFKQSWFVAGGWAIDLFLGKATRSHQDIEIAIFRKDQTCIARLFRRLAFAKSSQWRVGRLASG